MFLIASRCSLVNGQTVLFALLHHGLTQIKWLHALGILCFGIGTGFQQKCGDFCTLANNCVVQWGYSVFVRRIGTDSLYEFFNLRKIIINDCPFE
ncbi:hypothetical protein DF40_015400 [Stenotrophomonas maltophilia M30]|nr:hypothetical protein DF40_015400 [Stenotrophomonas maltophilia M30]